MEAEEMPDKARVAKGKVRAKDKEARVRVKVGRVAKEASRAGRVIPVAAPPVAVARPAVARPVAERPVAERPVVGPRADHSEERVVVAVVLP